MCGIAGYINWKTSPDADVLRSMEKCLAHRGPDEGNIWFDNVCGLAHRRLRVIDLSPLGAQPMCDESGELRVTFNGEIYNFSELRKQLQRLGHTFRSRSDTEVLLHGYESWQEGLFEKLRGMFVLALWNRRTEQLVFARDRLGKKPFFFSTDKDQFVFGSELTVFRQLPGLTLTISPSAFSEYVEFGYVQSPRTILKEVNQLPPGHFGVWNRAGLSLQSYWTIPDHPPSRDEAIGIDAAAEALDAPLRDAIAHRLISDVPLGCFLSGGIDSSLVAAHAQDLVGGNLKTYTVGFADSAMNEALHAAAVARHLGTDHHEIMISPESVIDEFIDILARASEPMGDDSFLPTFLISRETRREVTVALSGDGGDELFCGYDKYARFSAARRLRRIFPAGARRAALSLAGSRGGDRITKSLEALAAPDDEGAARWLSTLWKESELEAVLEPKFRLRNKNDAFSQSWNRNRAFPGLEQFMITDMGTYLVGDILSKVDRASMAHGLEVRNPLLDQEFVQAAFQFSCRARPGKAILKKMLARRLPPALFERPKQGFGMPVNDWYRGPLRHVLREYTAETRIRNRGLLNANGLERFVEAHVSGRRNFGRKLHAIVAFEVWADRFFGPSQTLA